MKRAEVLQRLLPPGPGSSYLEIGVQHGYTFHDVHADIKVAVDPHFIFDVAEKVAEEKNAGCSYYEVTSNNYFSQIRSSKELFDVIFIDGLHTFDQTLKDFFNALACLKPNGLIVLDDVMPVSYASSISDVAKFNSFRSKSDLQDGSWMGDVFKVPFFINSFIASCRYATVLENCAQMIVWQGDAAERVEEPMMVERIAALDYGDFLLMKEVLNFLPFAEIEKQIATSREATS